MTSHFTLSFKCNSVVIQRQYTIYLEIQIKTRRGLHAINILRKKNIGLVIYTKFNLDRCLKGLNGPQAITL